MKVSENKPHSIHLRLTEEQYAFLSADAEMLGISVSDYIRMIVNTTMYTAQKVADRLSVQLGGPRYADNQDNQQHIV